MKLNLQAPLLKWSAVSPPQAYGLIQFSILQYPNLLDHFSHCYNSEPYCLFKTLGEGSWGYVKEGEFRGQQVAVKCIHEAIVPQHTY